MGAVVLTDTAANAALDAITAQVNTGTVDFYTAARATLLGTVTLSATAFAAASARAATINAVTEAAAVAAGTAAEAVFRTSGAAERFSGTVTVTGGGGLVTFASLAWNIGDMLDITGGSLTYPA